jgi:hypothetical protein
MTPSETQPIAGVISQKVTALTMEVCIECAKEAARQKEEIARLTSERDDVKAKYNALIEKEKADLVKLVEQITAARVGERRACGQVVQLVRALSACVTAGEKLVETGTLSRDHDEWVTAKRQADEILALCVTAHPM